MKILLYNILDGCLDAKRFTKLIKFVNKESPDVMALLELNQWNDNDFKVFNEFKDRTGYVYSSFLETKTGYNIGVFSKTPFTSEKHFLKNFYHGLLKVTVNEVDFLITHLTPRDAETRLKEVEKILSLVSSNQKTIILGDLNSLSPHDGYDELALVDYMSQKKIIKFGSTKIEYTSIDLLEKSDFYDAYLLKNKKFKHSVPTPASLDGFHFTNLRLDYFFINSLLKPFIKKIQIIQNSRTDTISDHYPVMLFLKSFDSPPQ